MSRDTRFVVTLYSHGGERGSEQAKRLAPMSAPHRTAPAPLVGRAPELAHLRELLAAASDSHGSAVLLRGKPGLGKSALISQLVDDATDFTVLRCRGVETEAELPFAALHELLLPLTPQFRA